MPYIICKLWQNVRKQSYLCKFNLLTTFAVSSAKTVAMTANKTKRLIFNMANGNKLATRSFEFKLMITEMRMVFHTKCHHRNEFKQSTFFGNVNTLSNTERFLAVLEYRIHSS